ncbi:hypothetical protein [Caryophanon latum]|uniref:Uncharacterized protein n=1 Tax=Caryophanon latum TaxID=33977 RepID=A0A1C0YUK8_9BACL|nr:hypothetical protein [Caryophanon latum]OCS90833.1 hypothetical protein A6K76_01925 [Caryophanon latum]
MNDIIDELLKMTSSETIRQFRSHPKKVYKYYLAGILNDILFKKYIHESFFYHQAKFMFHSAKYLPNKDGEGYRKNKALAIETLKNNYFITPHQDSQIDILIVFFRNYLTDLKFNKKTLYLVSDLEKIIRIKDYFRDTNQHPIKNHHWIDITLHDNLIRTFPEFFNYQDLINLWNDYIKKYDKICELQKYNLSIRDNPEYRRLDYSYKGSERTLVILATNFVESYLYYYFYNIKASKLYPQNKLHKMKGYIQDTQIIEDLLFVEHPKIKENASISLQYNKFNYSIKIRDRFVHTSAFVEQTNKIAQLQPLLSLSTDETITILQNAIDFVYSIDNNLPENEKILFWWDSFETPDFNKRQFINPLNIFKS